MNTPTILTERQQLFLALLAAEEDLARTFVLSGGTALAAYHLLHRLSDDLDFFTEGVVDSLRVHRFVEDVAHRWGIDTVQFQRLYDRNIFLLPCTEGELKVEFTRYPFPTIEEGMHHDGIRVASLRDIAASKLFAMLDRFEPKDYFDLYILLRDGYTSLPALRKDVQQKFHEHPDPLVLGSILARGATLPTMPHLVEKIDRETVQHFFIDLAKTLKDEVVEKA